jgi:hypothetical protein
MISPFNESNPPTDLEKELGSYFDPRQNNINNYPNGQKVTCRMLDETRSGFVAKQIDERHFLVRLDFPFNKSNPGKPWLKVCRDYAHQVIT